jgi:hypothetical protein
MWIASLLRLIDDEKLESIKPGVKRNRILR